MEEYQTNQWESAEKLLEVLGVPGPYSLKEQITTIELLKLALESRIKSPRQSGYISMKEVANNICTEIYADRLRQQYSYPRQLFFLDWRDDLEGFSLVWGATKILRALAVMNDDWSAFDIHALTIAV